MTTHRATALFTTTHRGSAALRVAVTACLLVAAAVQFRPSVLAVARVLSDGPVVFGHYHVYVPDVAAQKKFWVEHLGGQPSRFVNAPIEIARFPNIIVLIQKRDAPPPSGPPALGHIALQVANLRAT